MIVKAPQPFTIREKQLPVFLAGSIEMGMAEPWQQSIEEAFAGDDRVLLLNPRRDDWDASWKQEKNNAQFHEQVSWELTALEQAQLIVFYFDAATKSPVTMLELGLFGKKGKALVCCPAGFWRKGNIDIVCERYGIAQADTLEDIINYIKIKLETV